MTRLNQFLLVCAALVAPGAALAGEAQEDPRAQVTTGFGPQSRAPRTRPTPPQVEAPSPSAPMAPALISPQVEEPLPAIQMAPALPAPGRARVQVPWSVSVAGAGFGLLTGGVAGFGLSMSFIDCSGSFFGFPSLQCLGGVVRSAAIGLSAGVAGAILGGWATTALYRSSQASVRVAPVMGKGAQGLAISGTF